MIEVKNLSKTYQDKNSQVKALKSTSLKIKEGTIFGIIGHSGAGKSTLIRCLNLLEQPTTGEVIVDGMNLTKLPPQQLRTARRKIGMIFQHFNLLSSRTVFDNVAFPLEIAGVSKDVIDKKVNNLLDLVGLQEKANFFPKQLSGGQKQRVGIARALANDPKVLLCDEATSALDPDTTQSILNLLQDINTKLNLTIVLITHEMQVIKEICHEVAVINDGHIVEQGPVLSVFTRPQHQVTKNFIKNIMKTQLPDKLYHGDNLIVQVSFIGQVAFQPIVAEMIQQFNVKANIIYGQVDHIRDTLFGTMTIELLGSAQITDQAIAFLQQNGLEVQVVKK